jgi:hypothetical protein
MLNGLIFECGESFAAFVRRVSDTPRWVFNGVFKMQRYLRLESRSPASSVVPLSGTSSFAKAMADTD